MPRLSRSSRYHPLLPGLLPTAEVFFSDKTPQLIQLHSIDMYLGNQHLIDLLRMSSRFSQPESDGIQFYSQHKGNRAKRHPLQYKLQSKNNFVFSGSEIIESSALPFTENRAALPTYVLMYSTALCKVSPIGNNVASPSFVIIPAFFVLASNGNDTRFWSSEPHMQPPSYNGRSIVYQGC